MKKFSVIFFACLLTLNIISGLRISPIETALLPSNSIRTQLAQMLLQVKQEDTSPKTIKMFIEVIQNMLSKLRTEQDEHQKISNTMMDQCTKEDEFRTKEVADATDALNRGTDARGKCEVSLKAAEKDLPELKSAHQTYVDELKRATLQREYEHEAYLVRKKDYEDAIVFLQDFIAYVKEKLGGTFQAFSFMEKSEAILRHSAKLGILRHAVPVLVLLAQAANEEIVPKEHNAYVYTKNEDIANKLYSALQQLLTKLNVDHQSNEDQEAKLEAAFQELKIKLTDFITKLEEGIKKTEQQIDDMTKCITEEDAIIAKAQNKLLRNTNLKDSARKMCDSFAQEFIQATNNRLDEIKTIGEILDIINMRFKDVAKDLVVYLENVKNGWEVYMNSTEYKKYVEYVQQHIQDNQEGRKLNNEFRLQ